MPQPRSEQSSDRPTPLALLMEHERKNTLGWSTQRMADEIGVWRQTYSRWLNAPTSKRFIRPSYENLEKIARILNRPIDEIIVLSGIGAPKLDTSLSPIQRQCIDIIKFLPDPYLDNLLPQLTALSDRWRKASES